MPTQQLDNYGVGQYQDYQQTLAYERVAGNLVLPCSDSAPVVITLHQEYGVVNRRYSGEKRGSPPMAPAPRDGETLLSLQHLAPLPIPIQSGGGSGYLYAMSGSITTLESTPSTHLTGYSYPGWPFRVEPMTTEAERAGYGVLTTVPPQPVDFQDPGYIWPQALEQPPECFSTDIP